MTQPFIGQIQPFGFNFAPKNWALCNGQTVAIQQNAALFSLLGTTYGGNGQTTFALPDLQSRVPMHFGSFQGSNYSLGQFAGGEQVTLHISDMPMHNHLFVGTAANGNSANVADGQLMATGFNATGPADFYYGPDANPVPLNPTSIGQTGGNQPHSNLQPYLTISWCICLFGIYPSRN